MAVGVLRLQEMLDQPVGSLEVGRIALATTSSQAPTMP